MACTRTITQCLRSCQRQQDTADDAAKPGQVAEYAQHMKSVSPREASGATGEPAVREARTKCLGEAHTSATTGNSATCHTSLNPSQTTRLESTALNSLFPLLINYGSY